jgi:hypothetical protein
VQFLNQHDTILKRDIMRSKVLIATLMIALIALEEQTAQGAHR